MDTGRRSTNNVPSAHLPPWPNPDREESQSAARTLSDDEISVASSDDIAWSEMAELSFTDEGNDGPPPASTSCAEAKHELQPLSASPLRVSSGHHKLPASVSSPTCIEDGKEDRRHRRHPSKGNRDSLYETSAPAHKMELGVDNSPYKDNNCSVPRSLRTELPEPQSMMGVAFRNVQHVFKTGFQSSIESLGRMPPKNTLRRCWGALKDTLDELGNVWDGDDGDNEHKEVLGSGVDYVRLVSAPMPPARQSPREPTTPQTRTLFGTVGSRPSHHDTLACSPVAGSRSSKRKPKPRLRYKSPTPRRKHGLDIDHAYSTEDESCDPHTRLLNMLLFPDPSRLPQEDLYVFMYKQDSRSGYFDANPENTKPVADQDSEAIPSGVRGALSGRKNAIVPNALGVSAGRSARQSVANLLTGECQHGLLRSQQTCEICNEVELGTAQPYISGNSSTPLISQDDDDSRARLLVSDSEAMASSTSQTSDGMRRIDRVPTPENLCDELKEIFSGHASGNKTVDRKGRPAEKLKFSQRIKEALRPQHPDLLQYKPGPVERSDAEPLASFNVHMSDDATVHRVVEHPPTLNSDPGCEAGAQLPKKVKKGIPKVEGRVNDWLGRIEPEDDVPSDLSSSGTRPPEIGSPRLEAVFSKVPAVKFTQQPQEVSAVEVTPQPKKAKRRPQIPDSCAVLSAKIPPERDITDLFRTPFGTFERELRKMSLGLPDPPPGDSLISAFGVSYDIVAASHNDRLLVPTSQQESAGVHSRLESSKAEEDLMSSFGVLCISPSTQQDVTSSTSPASDVLSQTAAMGSLSTLFHIDEETRRRNAETHRVKQDTAHFTNTSWLELDDAKKMPCCWKPSLPLSRNHSEHRAIRVYNLCNMFQATASRTPLLVIAHWLSMDEWNYRMQQHMKNA